MSTLVEPRTGSSLPQHEAIGARTGARIGLAVGLIATGVGLVVVALLGPLVTGVIDYHVTETLRNQTIGLDIVSLFVVAPLAAVAAVLVVRRHVAGAALALGIGAYTSYMFVQYALGPEYERLPGNSEVLFPLYLVLFAGGWGVALSAWNVIDAVGLPRSPRRDRLLGRFVVPVLAFLAFVRYIPALADWMSSQPDDAGYLAGPTFAWTIALLDLGVFLPATVIACVGLVRGAQWAQKALFTVVGWFGLVGPAVAAMAIVMYVNDDPNAAAGSVAMMTTFGLAFAGLAVFLFRPLFASRSPEKKRDRDNPHVLYSGVGLALGCGVGTAIGVIFGPMGLIIGAGVGTVIGLLIGAVVDWWLTRTQSATRARSDLS